MIFRVNYIDIKKMPCKMVSIDKEAKYEKVFFRISNIYQQGKCA